MKKLESMAADLFVKFSLEETGKKSNWTYLSKERKAEWMKDVLKVANHFLESIQADFKPLGKSQGSTVYESALLEGIRIERMNSQQMLEQIYEDLNNELEEFLDKE